MFYPAELLCCLSAKFFASIDSVVEFNYNIIRILLSSIGIRKVLLCQL
nr:MAG TPA: hypothetical protein [Caudoviricetes sp.]